MSVHVSIHRVHPVAATVYGDEDETRATVTVESTDRPGNGTGTLFFTSVDDLKSLKRLVDGAIEAWESDPLDRIFIGLPDGS